MKKATIISAILNVFQKSKQYRAAQRPASRILGVCALVVVILVAGCGSSNAPTMPAITTNPTSVTVTAGATATFTAAASGSPTPTVQWMVSTGGGAFTALAGATSPSLSFTTTAAQSGNMYEAVFTNSQGSVTSTAATLTVNTLPAITTNPTNVSVAAGATATFTAAATGSPAPTVQWQVSTNGGTTFTNVAGATTTTLSFATTASQNANQFKAVFTNAAGSTSTTVATLTVLAPALSIVKSHTGNFTVSTNGVFTIAVGNSGNTATTAPIIVTDTLPVGLTFVSGTGMNWVCAAAGQIVTCTNPGPIAGAAAAGSITLTTAVAANAPASVTNTAMAVTTGSANASSSDIVTVIAAPSPDLSIAKTAVGAFAAGSNGTFQIAVNNIGTASTTGAITVTDTLNSAFTFVSGTGTNWTCAAVLQVVTCTNPGPVANGSATGNITLTVAVGGTATGTIANTATVADPGDTTDMADKSSTANANIGTASGCAGLPTGNESMLHGQYAVVLNGWQGSGNGTPVAIAASFAADGTGNIATLTGGGGGDLDINTATGGAQHSFIKPSGAGVASTYTVGPDGTGAGFLGCAVVATGNPNVTVKFTFSLGGVVSGVASKGRIIEFDDTTGTGSRAAGEMRLQDTTAFSMGNTTGLHANYAFGEDGFDSTGHFAIAGSIVLNPATGAITSANFDEDDAGTLQTNVSATGSIPFTSVSAIDGRATLSITVDTLTTHVAIYEVNANEFFTIGTDTFNLGNPIISGKAVVSAASYTSAAIAGNQMLHLTGQDTCTISSVQAPCASAALGLLNFTASDSTSGTFTGDIYNYDIADGASAQNFPSATPGTFTLTGSTGRVALANAGGHAPVLYLATPAANTDPVTAFAVGTDSSAIFGAAEAGAASAITTSSMAGNYFFSNEDPGDNTVKSQVGVATIASSGVISGTAFNSGQSGLNTSGTVNGTLVVTNLGSASNSAPGTGNVGPNTIAITNGKRLLLIDESGGSATIVVIELQ